MAGKKTALWCALLVALAGTGCVRVQLGSGTFEKTLDVSGMARVEINGGSGGVEVVRGEAGKVFVRGEFDVYGYAGMSSEERIEELTKNPPITQQGDIILIGQDRLRVRNVRIRYTVRVPEETVLVVSVSSGEVNVSGIRGPVRLTASSGDFQVREIGRDVDCTTSSGNQVLQKIGGRVAARASSGSLVLEEVGGELRAETRSGRIEVRRAAGRIHAQSSSGRIYVEDAAGDVRATSRSGDIEIGGRPAGRFYWEAQASSGDVSLDLEPASSFRIEARTRSGRIIGQLPLSIEEQTKRLLRGRAGDGLGRITVETSSGDIVIR